MHVLKGQTKKSHDFMPWRSFTKVTNALNVFRHESEVALYRVMYSIGDIWCTVQGRAEERPISFQIKPIIQPLDTVTVSGTNVLQQKILIIRTIMKPLKRRCADDLLAIERRNR